jgi:hypothetical protein
MAHPFPVRQPAIHNAFATEEVLPPNYHLE